MDQVSQIKEYSVVNGKRLLQFFLNRILMVSLLRTEQIPYWKNYNSATIIEVTSLIKKNINSKQEFFDVGLKEIINVISISFFGKGQRIVKI